MKIGDGIPEEDDQVQDEFNNEDEPDVGVDEYPEEFPDDEDPFPNDQDENKGLEEVVSNESMPLDIDQDGDGKVDDEVIGGLGLGLANESVQIVSTNIELG